MPEPLPWPLILGSPADLAWAKIKLCQAQLNWHSSMSSELFDGVVTFSHEELFAAEDEYFAASKRHRDRRDWLADAPRRLAAVTGADSEAVLYV